MLMGQVIGTVVATRKDEELVGLTFLVVKGVDIDGNMTGPLVVGSILYLRKKTLADNMRSGPAATALLYVALAVMLLIGVGGIYALF